MKIGTRVRFCFWHDLDFSYGTITSITTFGTVYIATLDGKMSHRSEKEFDIITEAEYWLHVLER